MRKLAIVIGAIVVVIIALVLVLPHLIDVNQYRGQIQSQLQQRLNRPVQLGQMSLSVFPLQVEVNNVVIGEDPSFHSNVPFAQVGQLDISVKLFPLLTGNVEVESLEMKQAKIELIRNAQGVWNFSTAGNAPAPAAPATPVAARQAAGPGSLRGSSQFTLGELKITDGQIAITDYQKHQTARGLRPHRHKPERLRSRFAVLH